MKHLIDKDALVAEIERFKAEDLQKKSQCKRSGLEKIIHQIGAYNKVLSFLDTLEVREVGLKEEIDNYISNNFFGSQTMGFFANRTKEEPNDEDIAIVAKHFFELGLSVNNPITAADRGMAEEIIINLKRVEQDYRIDLTKEIEWVRSKVKKGM